MKITRYFDETHEVVGWLGAFAILLAYALNSFELILPDSTTYQGLNFVGALGIVYNAAKAKNYPPMILNLIWAIIGLVALAKILI